MSLPVKFGTYEIFRIVLPGFYFVILLLVALFLFPPARDTLVAFSENQTFLLAVGSGGVFLGLALYAYDHPIRIPAYRKLEMPSVYLKKRLCDACASGCCNKIEDEPKALDSYFYVFYNIFSPGVQQRVFYFGSVYRVFADIRMLSFFFACAFLSLSIGGFLSRFLSPSEFYLGLLLTSLLLLAWFLMHPEFFSDKNKSKGDLYLEWTIRMQRRFIDLELEEIRKKICRCQSETNPVQ